MSSVEPKESLPDLYPWYSRLFSDIITYVTWPFYVRGLKKMGFRRIGWMTWEAGPGEELWPYFRSGWQFLTCKSRAGFPARPSQA